MTYYEWIHRCLVEDAKKNRPGSELLLRILERMKNGDKDKCDPPG